VETSALFGDGTNLLARQTFEKRGNFITLFAISNQSITLSKPAHF